MILTETEINKISGGSVDYFDRIVFARAIEAALLAKLRGGVELPEAFAHAAYEEHPSYEGVGDIVYYHPNAKPANCIDLFTRRQLLAYGAAQRLAGREQAIEECAKEAERMTMYQGGRQEAPAHDSVWHAARAIRALAASPQEQT